MSAKKIFLMVAVALISVIILIESPLLAQKKPSKQFPNFMTQKDNIQKIYLVGDFVHYQDIKGEIDKVWIRLINVLWGCFQPALLEEFKAKNYMVEKVLLTSMGLYLEAKDRVCLIKAEPEIDIDDEKLPQGQAPFFVAPEVEADSVLKENLRKLYKALSIYVINDAGENNPIFPEAMAVAENSGCDTLLVVTILSRSVSSGKLLLQGTFGSIIGKAMMGPDKGMAYNLYILEANSGKLIWSERLEDDWAQIHSLRMKQAAKNITKKIPAKQKN